MEQFGGKNPYNSIPGTALDELFVGSSKRYRIIKNADGDAPLRGEEIF